MIRSTFMLCGLLSTIATTMAYAATPLTEWETMQPDEELDAARAAEDVLGQIKGDYADQGKRVFRDAHPRGIGCVAATFTVDANLPAKYQTGLYAQPGKSYDALIRFSSSLGPAGDNKPDARGMAIKLFGVPGAKLLDDQPTATTHDFIQINGPTFPARNIHDFTGIVHVKSKPGSVFSFLKEAPIRHARELKAVLDSSIRNRDNGKSLAETQFYSMSSYLLKGSSVNIPTKFTTRPCAGVPTSKLDGSEGELRNDLQNRLNSGDLCYEFLYQFYRDGAGFDVEDGMNNWGVDPSLFTRFATIIIPKQTFKTDAKLRYCDNLSYQPWHAIAEHRPLGNLNRARKTIYETVSKYRHAQNGELPAYLEPADISGFKGLTDPTFSVWDAVKVPATK